MKGLKVRSVNSDLKVEFEIPQNINRSVLEQFLYSIPKKFVFVFFDNYHPQISDPGAYVRVQQVGGNFLYSLANHGWSSEWKEIKVNELVDYILKNLPYADECFELKPYYKTAVIGERS